MATIVDLVRQLEFAAMKQHELHYMRKSSESSEQERAAACSWNVGCRMELLHAIGCEKRAATAPLLEQIAEWEKLKTPNVLHANLLRGIPAQLTPKQFLHLSGYQDQIAQHEETILWQAGKISEHIDKIAQLEAQLADERERCAKLCEERFSAGALDIADAIRKGPNTTDDRR